MKKLYTTILITLIIIFAILIISNYSINNIYKADVCYVEETNLVSSIISKGTIEEVEKAGVFTEFPLKVLTVNVKEGDKVKKGQTIAELDLSDMELELEKAQINAHIEQELLNKIKEGNSDNVDNKSEMYNMASKYLSESNSINKSSNDIEIQRKNVEIANIKLEELKRKMNNQDKYIKSPMDGIVTEINIDKGNYTQIGEPVVAVSNLDKLQIRLAVDEYYISEIKIGQKVKINAKALEDKEYNGYVKYIAPVATKKNNEVVVEVLVDIIDADNMLKPGYSIEARIITQTKEGVVTIPYEAILQDDSGKDYVYLVRNNVVIKQYIKTGTEMDFETEVIEGLKNKDILIINPEEKINNQTVKIEKVQNMQIGD